MLDIKILRGLETRFLRQYPKGFNDPEMTKIAKRHRMDKIVEMAQQCFAKNGFGNVHTTAAAMVKVVSRSSMVSMFEKPRFRDFVNGLNENDKAVLVNSLSQFLHGNQQLGFETMADILRTEKLAKWSLMTIIPAYYAPQTEVFVKPTTAKDIIHYFKLSELTYKPAPTWEFYTAYREMINEAKIKVSKDLSPSNAAFSGFLMMSVKTAN